MLIALRVPAVRESVAIATAGFRSAGLAPSSARRGPFVDVAAEVRPRSPAVYAALFNALVEVDIGCIRKYRLGRLYESDVVYCREPQGREVWQSSAALYATGMGDCEDLACHRVAELTLSGRKARVRLTYRPKPDGGRLYHVTVWRAQGCAEDPSFRLGMRGRDQ